MSFDAAMAILDKDTGSHFDPAVIAAFHPMAWEIHDRLDHSGDSEVRQLLEARVRLHFEM